MKKKEKKKEKKGKKRKENQLIVTRKANQQLASYTCTMGILDLLSILKGKVNNERRYQRICTLKIRMAPLESEVAQEKLMALTSPSDPHAIYKKLEKIGHGSASNVYKGQIISTEKYVAMKYIAKNSQFADSRRLLYEAETLRNYTHPNIVTYLGCFMLDSDFLLVMEYVPGVSLKKLIKSGLGMNAKPIVTIVRHILLGLASLHANRIMHRDLKSSNVMLGEDGVTKIIDLGLCVYENEQLTQGVGTRNYMAPEVHDGGNYDCKADIWSLGCIIMEITTGLTPVYHLNKQRSEIKIWNRFRDNVQICPRLKDFTLKCLTVDPKKRPDALSLLEHRAMRDTAPLSDISKLVAEVKKGTVIPHETSSEILFNMLNEYPIKYCKKR